MNDADKTREELLGELTDLRREVARLTEVKQQAIQEYEAYASLHRQLLSIYDNINDVVYVADPETYEVLYVNKATRAAFGDVIGEKCFRAFQNRETVCPFCTNDRIFGIHEGLSYIWEFQNTVNNRWYRCIDKAIPWPDGRMVRYEMAIDVTDFKQAEDIIARQSLEILELSTPVIQAWEGVVAAPLIGTMDSQRTQIFMERFLDSIVQNKAPVALVDITGVPTMDTQTAQHILEAISAARLLGTQVILTGVSPAIAQTLVHLGIDLGELETKSSLVAGLRLALNILGLEVVKVPQKKKEAH